MCVTADSREGRGELWHKWTTFLGLVFHSLAVFPFIYHCQPACQHVGSSLQRREGCLVSKGTVGDKDGQQEDRKRRGGFQKDIDKEEVVQQKSVGT